MTQVFTGRDFTVQTELAVAGEGVCPLLGNFGEHLGDLKGLVRVNCKLGDDWPESFVDQGNGSYFRVSNDGVGYGTSVVGCPGFRTIAATHSIPRPERVQIDGDPDDDNLNVWLEWIDAPRALESGTSQSLDIRVTSMPCVDRVIPTSQPSWPARLWWKATDYSHPMTYDYVDPGTS